MQLLELSHAMNLRLLFLYMYPVDVSVQFPAMANHPAIHPALNVDTPRCASEPHLSDCASDHPFVAIVLADNGTASVPSPSISSTKPLQAMHVHGHPCLQVADVGNEEVACEAIEHEVRRCREALDMACPQDRQLLASRSAALGRALECRYLHTWSLEDLEERLTSWRDALDALTRPMFSNISRGEISETGTH